MSWEAWGDPPDDGWDTFAEAGCWSVDEVDDVLAAIKALTAEQVYEDGQKDKGVSVKFLMRITLLEAAAGLRPHDDPLVVEAEALTNAERTKVSSQASGQDREEPKQEINPSNGDEQP